MKPLELVERAVENSSLAGDAVLDLFLGSGTTLVAAERTGRVCYLKVLGKGNKERIVPFGSASQKTLWRYHKLFRPEPIDTETFFLTEEGYRFTQDGFKSLFQRLAQRSGIPRLHAHLLRHTFATKYLMAGGDIFSLQQILGHTSLEMVRRYVTLASQHVVVQHRKFSPMDRVIASSRRRSA